MLERTKTAEPVTDRITITPPNMQTAVVCIRGTAPYVGNKMSSREMAKMRADQAIGQQAKSRKKREPKDFAGLHREKIHIAEDGWYGIPCAAFRNALIDACRVAGYKMVMAKMSVFVLPDGLDKDDGQPLVRLISNHEPRSLEMLGRYNNVSTDILVRPQWLTWAAKVRVKWDNDQFGPEDVINLMARAGEQVGVGAGRPFSKETTGIGWGTWEVVPHLEASKAKQAKRSGAKQR